MAIRTARLFSPAYLGNSATTLYTVPTNSTVRLQALTLANTDTEGRLVTVYLVPSGGGAGTGNIVVPGRVIAPGDSFVVTPAIGHTMSGGDKLVGVADVASKVVAHGSGLIVN